jgi:hypothetical protein
MGVFRLRDRNIDQQAGEPAAALHATANGQMHKLWRHLVNADKILSGWK